jgi:hypothetical protein
VTVVHQYQIEKIIATSNSNLIIVLLNVSG